MSETIYGDDTGAFPYILQFGKKIIMIAIHVDANYIFAETMKNKSDGERIHAYQKIIDRMKKAKLGLRNTSSTMRYQKITRSASQRTE